MTAGNQISPILADGRWQGKHGIGRFTTEVLARLKNTTTQTKGPKPLSLFNLLWQPLYLFKTRKRFKIYFNPGFNALLCSSIPFVFVIHDLNHLHFPHTGRWIKKIYYHSLIKWTAKNAHKILTPSAFSKKTILEWISLPADKVIVVGSGVSAQFKPHGDRYQPGFSYLLHVGNTKIHKNCVRLVQAFAQADIHSDIKLIFTGEETAALSDVISYHNVTNRVIFSGKLTEEQLCQYYRGALALVFPSLYEGFGLPVVEAMASGTPVLTSNVTSLPEIAGNAAMLVNPLDISSIAKGITDIVTNQVLRTTLKEKGLEQAELFSWDRTASIIQKTLDESVNAVNQF